MKKANDVLGPIFLKAKLRSPDTPDEQYGELTHTAVAEMIRMAHLAERDHFLDIGHGIGNVCLQVAYASKCTTFGIEVRKDLLSLSKNLYEEVTRNMPYTMTWITLKKGDLRTALAVGKVPFLSKMSCVFVNNKHFQPELQKTLLSQLHLAPSSCKVISTEPLIPSSSSSHSSSSSSSDEDGDYNNLFEPTVEKVEVENGYVATEFVNKQARHRTEKIVLHMYTRK
mmetsp:Transcript_35189/g.56900  ORF Transcript_35189/g.56900 Transcript_35189/m.56900 type:complete len:226 (-) Transcript_35189:362-1039(-)